MRRFLKSVCCVLSLVSVLVLTPVQVLADDQFTYEITGSFTLMPNGRPTGMSFRQRPPMAVRDLVRMHTDGWRFAPVLENGEPVAVPVKFAFSLIGTPVGEYVDFSFDDERFSEMLALEAAAGAVPEYPANALMEGVEAKIIMLVEIDDEGTPVHVHPWRVDLADSDAVARLRVGAKDRHARAFAAAAVSAMRGFQFVAPSAMERTIGFSQIVLVIDRQADTATFTLGTPEPPPWSGPRIDLLVDALTDGDEHDEVASRRLRRVDEDFGDSGW